ncbi:BamA/TamA family outer membrane protein [Deminuibacter soli]|uniref:Bacterial surface antigen (D15) domain-containing protein n=1 Tax=Deminuibacter soli TaxID=2291815 RepID=A0A3E1NKA9_9BACT|nr:BamA/TamA family outer membrane protein [Deminuibacter soli]RFM28353.1 hypothetical protein DXN05_12170 [Deminuibacter soli]
MGLLKVQAQTSGADSVTVAIAPEYNDVSGFHRFLFGENYRPLWALPLRIRVFHLAKEKGGLTIVQKGGGLQTKSLRLRDASGKEWVIRTIQKYPERGLPPDLRATIAKDILQDQVSAAHPFAALTVPPMAAALGVTHTNPEIVYIPDDTALGQYRADFANSVFLFEEREPLDAVDTDNTPKAQKKLQEDNDVIVDQQLVLRARLLDMLIGDWDRHEDQWRWQKEKTKKQTLYSPVPRDRDQVYYNTGGVFPWIVSHQWLKSKFQGFGDHIRDINAFNFNARYFDRYFLNRLSEQDWRNAIADIQQKLSDTLIRSALHRMPDTVYALTGERIFQNMVSRRKALAAEAMEYYRFLARDVDVPASDKRELFAINYGDSGHVNITITKIAKSGETAQVLYQRSFKPGETNEVRLYGFDGDDIFSVTGSTPSSVKVRMIGGAGADSFAVNTQLPHKPGLYIYDRYDEHNVLPAKSKARFRLANDTIVNSFDPTAFKFNRLMPLVSVNYNFDEGIIPRFGLIWEKHGFRQEPFSMRQSLIANYSISRRAFSIVYNGVFRKFVGNNDLGIDAALKGPNGVGNFFGIGNEAVFVNKGDQRIEYYRNRYNYLQASARLFHPLGNNFVVNAGIGGQWYNSNASKNSDHYLAVFDAEHPEERVFSNKQFASLVAGLTYDNRNDTVRPSKGWLWRTNITGNREINGGNRTYGQITSIVSNYVKPFTGNSLVIANRLGVGTTVGDPYYFQQLYVGGQFLLRGYHTARFTGKTMLYHNIELRERLFHFTSYLLPGTVGITAFNDLGRVWQPGEGSGKWHDGYGGGIYVEPGDLVLLQVSIGHSVEGTASYLSIGYRF